MFILIPIKGNKNLCPVFFGTVEYYHIPNKKESKYGIYFYRSFTINMI